MDIQGFKIKDKDFGGIYPHMREIAILESMLKEIKTYKLGFVIPVFRIAWNSRFWETHGYDGGTGIKDPKHPSIIIFIHDWMYRVFGGDYIADHILLKLSYLSKEGVFMSYVYYSGSRIFGSVFRVLNKLKGVNKDYPSEVKELYVYLKGIKIK